MRTRNDSTSWCMRSKFVGLSEGLLAGLEQGLLTVDQDVVKQVFPVIHTECSFHEKVYVVQVAVGHQK
jgi:hypothetical protein